ncbi:MAG: phage tail sheath subtilisin-like domain-containing protein [Candidatus Competibacteraceae bacterium]
MAPVYKTPGVYREDVFLRLQVQLPTGVPGFVGFGKTVTGAPVLLHRAEELGTRFTPVADVDHRLPYLADAVAGFFGNGGESCYVVGADAEGDHVKAIVGALSQLGPLADLDLVAVPDAMILPEEDIQRVQAAVIAHCGEHGNRFAVLDAPGGKNPREVGVVDALNVAVDALKDWCRAIIPSGAARSANAALYYPWIKVPSVTVTGGKPVPPCGHVAGIFARSDRRVGVFKAPANEELDGVLDLEFPIDAAVQDQLNPEGINCLRAFPGRGLRVWGARTLSVDLNWRYINVRRLFLTLVRWIDRNLAWAAFEPNTPRLWVRIQRDLNVHLGRLLQAGALKGASASEAFYVKCDSETNPAEEREQGRVTTEIGLAPAAPAEFIVVRIIHGVGTAQFR